MLVASPSVVRGSAVVLSYLTAILYCKRFGLSVTWPLEQLDTRTPGHAGVDAAECAAFALRVTLDVLDIVVRA